MPGRYWKLLEHRCRPIAVCVIAALASIGVLFSPALKFTGAMANEPSETLAISTSKSGAIALGAGPVEVSLSPASSRAGVPLGARIAATKPDQKLYLIVKGLRTNEQPEVLYQIYFALPPGVTPSPDGLHYIGSLNFFNAGNGDRNAANGGSSRVYSYDVTDLVRSLQARKLLGETPTVTIIPKGKPVAAAKAFIGEIALVQQ